MTWELTKWSDPVIKADDWGGSPLQLRFPDGTIIFGKLSVEPNSVFRQNDEVVMARIVTPYSGDTWINVHLADVYVWETVAWEEEISGG